MPDIEKDFEIQFDESELNEQEELIGEEQLSSEKTESDEDRFFEESFETDQDDETALDEESAWEGEAELVSSDEEDRISDYADRFYEISHMTFESSSDLESAIYEVLDDMERDYFWGWLKKKGKSLVKGLAKVGKKIIKGTGLGGALRGITQLARGNLKGALGSLAKAALPMAMGVVPGGGAMLPVLKSTMGFEAYEEDQDNREAWRNFAEVSKEAFEHLAQNMTPAAHDPIVANRLAMQAVKAGLNKARQKRIGPKMKGKSYRIRVQKGQKKRIIIEGV